MTENPNQCSQCGGQLLHGEPLHCCNSNGGNLYWCIECAEYISSASWDHEEWGPYQFTVTCNAQGRA